MEAWQSTAHTTQRRYPPEIRKRERMKALERENGELRRANEILKSAAAFFGAELDRRSPGVWTAERIKG
jgi:transposase